MFLKKKMEENNIFVVNAAIGRMKSIGGKVYFAYLDTIKTHAKSK